MQTFGALWVSDSVPVRRPSRYMAAVAIIEATTTPTNGGDSDVALAAAGDRRAFERLYRLHVKRVFSLCARMVPDRTNAGELTQDVFVQVYKSLPAARTDLPLKPWLYVIARNKCLDFIKRKRPQSFTDIEGDDEEGDGFATSHGSGNVVHRGRRDAAVVAHIDDQHIVVRFLEVT